MTTHQVVTICQEVGESQGFDAMQTRHLTRYVLKKHFPYITLQSIADLTQAKDHSPVMRSVRLVEDLYDYQKARKLAEEKIKGAGDHSFVEAVKTMRQIQKLWWATRSPEALSTAKRLENHVDTLLEKL